MVFDFRFMLESLLEIIKALPLTLTISIVPLIIGFGIGIGVALIRINKVPVIHRLVEFYVSFLRGTPLLMHIMIIYFGLPLLFDTLSAQYGWGLRSNSIPILVFVLVAFSLNAGAYMSEIIRSGILSVSSGQLDAAYAVGMTTWQTMARIVLPQALAVSFPMLCSLFIGLLQGSSLAFSVSMVELTGKAQIVATTNLKFLESYVAAALIYWGLTLLAERLTALLEKRVSLYNRGGMA